MGISLGTGSISALKLGSTSVSKAYLGTILVFPEASGFGTGTISNAGSIKAINNTYQASQFSTSGSGSGATFNVVIVSRAAASFTITNAGSGYAVNDTVTLDLNGVPSGSENPRVVLTVSTLV